MNFGCIHLPQLLPNPRGSHISSASQLLVLPFLLLITQVQLVMSSGYNLPAATSAKECESPSLSSHHLLLCSRKGLLNWCWILTDMIVCRCSQLLWVHVQQPCHVLKPGFHSSPFQLRLPFLPLLCDVLWALAEPRLREMTHPQLNTQLFILSTLTTMSLWANHYFLCKLASLTKVEDGTNVLT